MRVLRSKPYLIPVLVGVIVLAANLASTQLAWQFNKQRIETQITQIGEIYLDGLAASIRVSIENGSFGDTDKRLRSAFFEQSGIKERLLLVFNSAGVITNIAGKKALATDEVTKLEPGTYTIDYDSKTLVASRRIGDGQARATAVLDIDFVLQNYNYAESKVLGMNAGMALLAALATAALMLLSGMLTPFGSTRRVVAAE